MFARAELHPHPAGIAPGDLRVTAEITRQGAGAALGLRYLVEGNVCRLRIAAREAVKRANGLWQHTCFELFLKPDDSDRYLEFNFSPSGAWAAYVFACRRGGMRALAGLAVPAIVVGRGEDSLEVRVKLALPDEAGLRADSPVHAGLCAVLEDLGGRHSFWALGHGGPAPDFHDPRTFLLALAGQPAPGQAPA